MSTASQTRALKNYRRRLNQRGLARFEVLGLSADRQLIRTVARKLTENSAQAEELRVFIRSKVSAGQPEKGGILAALRRSPLVGAEIELTRPRIAGRKVDL
jgi:hypothetical protein